MVNILLDIDGTLLDFLAAEAQGIRKTLPAFGVEATPEVVALYSKINDEQWKDLENGKIDKQRLLTRRFEILYETLGVTADPVATQKTYEKNLSEGFFLMPGAISLLETLFPRYPLYITSNGTKFVQRRRIAGSGIDKYFRRSFLSEEIGFVKPEKEYFDCVFKELTDFVPSETVLIGDSLSSDIRGANNAGIRSIWYNPAKKPPRPGIFIDLETDDLRKIPSILETLFPEKS